MVQAAGTLIWPQTKAYQDGVIKFEKVFFLRFPLYSTLVAYVNDNTKKNVQWPRQWRSFQIVNSWQEWIVF